MNEWAWCYQYYQSIWKWRNQHGETTETCCSVPPSALDSRFTFGSVWTLVSVEGS